MPQTDQKVDFMNIESSLTFSALLTELLCAESSLLNDVHDISVLHFTLFFYQPFWRSLQEFHFSYNCIARTEF